MKVLVVGAGASGVHFALTALQRGFDVTMIDVGHAGTAVVAPHASYRALKHELADPVSYFLGETYSGAVLPGPKSSEYYGLPPSKDYVFATPNGFSYAIDGLAPLFSFAGGGLAQAWTAGAYPLTDGDLADFPFAAATLAPHFDEVAERIGVAGDIDDLSHTFPGHRSLHDPLTLDESSRLLLERYRDRRHKLPSSVRLGRSRQAVLSRGAGERDGCRYCGRCLWGCPNGALYTPSMTLQACAAYRNFSYKSRRIASWFALAPNGEIERLVSFDAESGIEHNDSADVYALACGALGTSNLFLRSIYRAKGEIVELGGLMDNRQILAPFFHSAMLGKAYNPDSYQYHQLAMHIVGETPRDEVHGQITTLKTADTQPIFQALPLDTKSAVEAFATTRVCLGVVNLNFADWRRPENFATLSRTDRDSDQMPILSLRYRPATGEADRLREALATTRRFFGQLGAPIVPGMTHVRPMGASVHYAGTLAMSTVRLPGRVSPTCQSYDISNLVVVDGACLPSLPAKNITFTLMANAVRVAHAL